MVPTRHHLTHAPASAGKEVPAGPTGATRDQLATRHGLGGVGVGGAEAAATPRGGRCASCYLEGWLRADVARAPGRPRSAIHGCRSEPQGGLQFECGVQLACTQELFAPSAGLPAQRRMEDEDDAVLRSVRVSAASSATSVIVIACSGSAAKRDIVASGCLYDRPDGVHNDLRLVDRHNVTGLLSGDQTSSF